MQFASRIADQKLKPDHTEAVEIVPRVRSGTAALFGGHVQRRSGSAEETGLLGGGQQAHGSPADLARLRRAHYHHPAEAEIGEFQHIAVHENVRRFQIAVD